MLFLKYLLPIFIFCAIVIIYLKFQIKLKKDDAIIFKEIDINEIKETSDLRISSKLYSNILINFGENFDYIKFQFYKDKVLVYFRDSTMIYHGPFLISEKQNSNLSYFSTYKISKFQINKSNNSLTLGFGNLNFIGLKLNLEISNINNDDLKLIALHINEC